MMGGSSSTIHENSTLVATDVAAIAVVNSAIKAGDQGIQRKKGIKGRYSVIIVTNNGTLETPIRSCMGSHKI